MSETSVWNQEELTCKPIRSVEDLARLLEEPPPWRSLCVPLKQHSPLALKNIELSSGHGEITVGNPLTFCHFSQTEVTDVKRYDKRKITKTLVCHDMANGYHDDCFVDGTGNYDAYTFYNWAAIDTFVYFSHHFITVPPLGWINVAHAHGTKVLGTVITEWADGEALWEKILSSEEEWRSFGSRLAAVAKVMRFDGWLLNVENKVRNPKALVKFVAFLRDALRQELPSPQLLWYDAVTVAGDLSWQNGLNEKNQAFFDACDGIFTNYSWTERAVAESVVRAGTRVHDVFVGLDVWGRNFHGGGQFNTQEAVKIAHKHGCSLAIFAPAWTHEAIPRDAGPPLLEQFLLRERAFWGSLWPFLSTRLPSSLPFQTSFCRGQGVKRRLYGEVIGPVPWYNLRHMQYQPNSCHGPHGYVLTTVESVLRLSKQGFVRDVNGVIRYREAFLEAATVSSGEAEHHLPTDHEIVLNEGVHAETEDTVALSESVEVDGKPGKRKMKDVFTKIFKVKTRSKGHVDSNSSKINAQSVVQLSVNLQEVDPNNKCKYVRYALARVPGELECLQPYFGDSFNGGSCLKVNPADDASPELRTIRIFHSDFMIEDTLVVCVVTKTLRGQLDLYLDLILHVMDCEGASEAITLSGRDGHEDDGGERLLLPVAGEEFRKLQKYLLLNEARFYVPTENSHGWIVRYYRVVLGGGRVTSVNARVGGGGGVLLGHLGLCHMTEADLL